VRAGGETAGAGADRDARLIRFARRQDCLTVLFQFRGCFQNCHINNE
jgi:hypothetical protein